MRHLSRARARRRSPAGRYVALLPLAAVAVAAYLARSHHPATAAEAGGPELAAFSVEGYEDPGNTSLS